MLSTINLFTDIIASYKILEQDVRLGLSKTKIKVIFPDNSVIFLREIIIQNVLLDYSYHWQKADGTLIIRWDDTVHYPSLAIYPHHKHVGPQNDVQESHEQTLFDVLNFIRQQFPS